jgi:SWI/SNF-related matrix-associated actin-dependent regulator of chromatin subfamily A member 5
MGLGKTLQSISILAYHYEFRNSQGPHLICVPKSTLSNWMNELKRWCPAMRAIKFHGSRDEREYMIDNFFTNEAAAHDGKRPTRQIMNDAGELVDDNTETPRTWDVCVTTYEVANQERRLLQKFAWKYLVIDEVCMIDLFSRRCIDRDSHHLWFVGSPFEERRLDVQQDSTFLQDVQSVVANGVSTVGSLGFFR